MENTITNLNQLPIEVLEVIFEITSEFNLDGKQNIAEAIKAKKIKYCDRCGKKLPIDCAPSIYTCTAGRGCASFSYKGRQYNSHEENDVNKEIPFTNSISELF